MTDLPPVSDGKSMPLVAAVKAEDDPFVTKAFFHHPLADADLVHQIDRALFEHACPNDGFDIVTAVFFENHRLDALQVEDVRQQKACWSGTDNSDLSDAWFVSTKKVTPRSMTPVLRRGRQLDVCYCA